MARIDWARVLARAEEIVRSYSTAVTLRQLHYRLVSAPELGYPNTQTAYKRLSELTAALRREGKFPRLSDLTRSVIQNATWESPKEAIEEAASTYARDRTEGQEVTPLIVLEKATLSAQVRSWFGAPLGITIAPLRGYSSESFDRAILNALREGREYRVLYVGDHDPSGHDIERHGEEQMGWRFAEWERVALTPEIVSAYGLPENPGKKSDSRAAGFKARHGKLIQVEVEALDPDDLRDLLQQAIDRTWDTSAFETAKEREKKERELLRGIAESL